MLRILAFVSISLLTVYNAMGQTDSMLNSLDVQVPVQKYVDAAFKSSRLVNFHTVETTGKRTLDLKISHRFGDLSGGLNTFFGIDGPANIRIGLEYSPDGRIQAGIGRTSYQKTYDGFLKYKLFRQRTDNAMPVTITLLSCMYVISDKDPSASFTGYDHYQYFTSRMSYNYQVLIARKFSERFSAQLAPTMIHQNLVEKITDRNDMYAIVVMARYKFTKRMAIAGEYAYRLSQYTQDMTPYHNSVGLSLEFETGGHVFQIVASNSFGLLESQTIPYTTNDVTEGHILIGFNIGRFFTL
jgi:hypothetical protein